MRLLALLLVILSTPALADPSMDPRAWTFEHSVGMPAHPVKHGKTGWRFVFPRGRGDVDYLTSLAGQLRGGRSITVAGKIVAPLGVRFVGTDVKDTGKAAPSFHLFIQARGDECLCRDFGRWWSIQKVTLKNGPFRLTVALHPSRWQSVFGHRGDSSPAARRGFASAVANAAKVGFTFGHGNNFGHGVRTVGGFATMAVMRYSVDR